MLWQKPCDRLLDKVLCNYCTDEKDEAFAQGKGLDWIPANCSDFKTVRRIFEQTVTYREWQEPLMYADDEPHTMWAWNPLSKDDHKFRLFLISQTMPLTIYTGGAKGVDTNVEHLSQVWSSLRSVIFTLSPLNQVPRGLVQARIGRGHAHRYSGSVSIRSSCLPSHHPPVFTASLSRGQAYFLSLGFGVF